MAHLGAKNNAALLMRLTQLHLTITSSQSGGQSKNAPCVDMQVLQHLQRHVQCKKALTTMTLCSR